MTEPNPAILIPIKTLPESKSRLRPVLDDRRRIELMKLLVKDLVHRMEPIIHDSGPVAVVTEDPWVEEFGRQTGLVVLEEPSGCSSLGEVVDEAARRLDPTGPLVVFPVDLPLITASHVKELIERFRSVEVGLVPDVDESGTNFLWRNPAEIIPCRYEGTASFEDHRESAEEANCSLRIERSFPVSIDLDTPADLEVLRQHRTLLTEPMKEFLDSLPATIR